MEYEARKQHTAINIISQLKDATEEGFTLPHYEEAVRLPCYDITLYTQCGVSRITSDLHRDDDEEEHTARLDGLESLILAHFSACIDVLSDEYVEGIETAVEAIFNRV